MALSTLGDPEMTVLDRPRPGLPCTRPSGPRKRCAIRPLLALACLLAPASAFAGSTVLPTAPLVGDGKTTATIEVVFDDPSARVLKVKADKGKVGATTALAGAAMIEIVPPKIDEPTTISLQIQVRGAVAHDDLTATIDVRPAPGAGYTITFDPPVALASSGGSIKVVPNAKNGIPDAQRRLKLSVSSGTATDLVPSGDGSFVAHYTPPSGTSNPLQVEVAVVDLAAPFVDQGHATLPVSVDQSVTFDAPAGSNSVLDVGGRQIGPIAASPSGKVAFQLQLSPTVRKARLSTVNSDGSKKVQDVDLPMKVGAAMILAGVPDKAPAGATIPVTLYCVDPQGSPCAAGTTSPSTLSGMVSAARSIAPGVEQVDWTLPTSGTATITWALNGQDARASTNVAVLPSTVTMSLSSDPPSLPAGKKDFAVTAHLKDGKGSGVTGRPPTFSVDGASPAPKATTKDNGDGSYTLAYKLTGAQAVVRAAPPVQASGLPVADLVLWTDRNVVWADGAGLVDVVVVAEDALGLPVPNVDLQLSVPMGDGSVPPTVKTGADGAARVTYRVGSAAGPVAIVAEGAGRKVVTTLWQTAIGGAAPEMRPSGDPSAQAAIARWQSMLPTVKVAPEAPATTAAATPTPTPVVVPSTPPPTMVPTVAPATVASPSVGTPGTVSPGRTPKAPHVPSATGTAGQVPFLRLRVGLSQAPFKYTSTLKGTSDLYAPEASFSLKPFGSTLGVAIQGELWVGKDRTIGVDGRFEELLYSVKVGDDVSLQGTKGFWLAGRYKVVSNDPWGVYVSGGFAGLDALAFQYTSETKQTADVVARGKYGLRAGGGVVGDWTHFGLRADLSETFTPLPSSERLDVAFDTPILLVASAMPDAPRSVAVTGGLEARHVGLSVGDDAKVRSTSLGWNVGLGLTLMLF